MGLGFSSSRFAPSLWALFLCFRRLPSCLLERLLQWQRDPLSQPRADYRKRDCFSSSEP